MDRQNGWQNKDSLAEWEGVGSYQWAGVIKVNVSSKRPYRLCVRRQSNGTATGLTTTSIMDFDPNTHPHRRYNPLTGEHVLVSPHRNRRPWQGQTEQPQSTKLPQYDPDCYLCPGNVRAGGNRNEAYDHTMVFVNDFAAVLSPPGPIAPPEPHHLLTTKPVQGGCDVIIFHPRHDLTLARLPIPDIERVIEEWCAVYTKRSAEDGINYVQIFEVGDLERNPPEDHFANLQIE